MDLQRLRMNLVHRDVKMLVLLLAVPYRDVLVFLEPRRAHGAANHLLELRRGQASVLWVKRNDQMVCLASLGPLIAFLEQLHHVDRKPSVFRTIEVR